VNPDPGNQWAEKPLSVRLTQIKRQWINLGPQQLLMIDNLILSAEYLEEQLAMKTNQAPKESSATNYRERLSALRLKHGNYGGPMGELFDLAYEMAKALSVPSETVKCEGSKAYQVADMAGAPLYVPVCADHAESWFTERDHLAGGPDAECIVCASARSATRENTLDKVAALMLRHDGMDLDVCSPGNHGGRGADANRWLVTLAIADSNNFREFFGDTLEEALRSATL
jgi:hypothetical protein